jgi:phosphoribosylanthranilate isomerase
MDTPDQNDPDATRAAVLAAIRADHEKQQRKHEKEIEKRARRVEAQTLQRWGTTLSEAADALTADGEFIISEFSVINSDGRYQVLFFTNRRLIVGTEPRHLMSLPKRAVDRFAVDLDTDECTVWVGGERIQWRLMNPLKKADMVLLAGLLNALLQ